MKEMFCERCGTLITEAESRCSFCNRRVDWATMQQFDAVQPEMPSKQGNFPQRIFGQQKQEQLPNQPQQYQPAFRAVNTARPSDPTGRSDFFKPLGLGEMILLVLCWFIPILGTVLLALASFVDTEEYRNRKTAARALLIVQLVLIILTMIVMIAFVRFVMSVPYSTVPNTPIW